MQGLTAYRGFQEPRNRHLAGGVEPSDAAVLLAPTTGGGEDSTTSQEATSAVVPSIAAASLTAFSIAAASTMLLSVATLSAATASSVAFFTAAASTTSFSTTALKSAASSFVAPDVPGAATRDVTADELGRGVAIATGACCPIGGGPPTGHSPLWSNLLLCRGWSSSDAHCATTCLQCGKLSLQCFICQRVHYNMACQCGVDTCLLAEPHYRRIGQGHILEGLHGEGRCWPHLQVRHLS
jgi:hypothetical protein